MDVNALLDIERRTGVKNADIEDFARKAEDLNKAIKGLMDGTLNPEDVKIDGIETDEEKQQKEAERAERRRVQQEKDEQLRQQRKLQERERWWAGAETFRPRKAIEATEDVASTEASGTAASRHTLDYSKWDSWVPTDQASEEERAQVLAAEEERRNREFEESNPEFCQQFVQDMEARKRATTQKQESADALRARGNRLFKARDFVRALELYMDALRHAPFDGKLLLNVAQVHIKLRALDDAAEFVDRTLYLDRRNVKAWSRRAFLLGEAGRVDEALEALQEGLCLEPSNTDLVAQRRELDGVRSEREAERRLRDGAVALDRVDALVPLLLSLNVAALGPALDLAAQVGPTADAELLRVHACKSGALGALFSALQALSGRALTTDELILQARLVRTCADWIDTQRSAQVAFVEAKMLAQLKGWLTGEFGVERLPLLVAATECLRVCVTGGACAKLQAAVAADPQLPAALAALLGGAGAALSKPAPAHAADGIVFIASALHVLQALGSHSAVSLCAVGSALNALLLLRLLVAPIEAAAADAAVEPALAVLLAMSTQEPLRAAFAVPLPVPRVLGPHGEPVDASASTDPAPSTLLVLRRLCAAEPAHTVNALAIFMNASIAGAGTAEAQRLRVLTELHAVGALDLARPGEALAGADAAAVQARVRRAGLLSRLALLPAVQAELAQEPHYRALCRHLHAMTHRADELYAADLGPQWRDEERAVYARLLAALPVAQAPGLLRAGREEHVVESLLQLLPAPRSEGGEITPASVVQAPPQPAPAALLGNAARALIPFFDDAALLAELVLRRRDTLLVEKLVCAMATCTDMRVRKNVAILLAKACRASTEVRERVSAFRGLQMMVELQTQLL